MSGAPRCESTSEWACRVKYLSKRRWNRLGWRLRECGEFAADLGVQIRLEVHGGGTSELPHIRTIIDVADHDNVYVCWNSNFGEVENGSIQKNFDLVKGRIGLVHITELHRREYPWRELFTSLKTSGYTGYTLAEIAGSSDPVRVMNFYRALWEELTR